MTTGAEFDEPDPAEIAAFRARHAAVLERTAAAARRAGREPAEVRLVAVSKTVPAERLRAAVAAGLTALGENRVLEGEALSSSLSRTGCFPDLVLDRLSVGENTGNVVPCLRDISATYQQKISRQLNMFTKVIASAILGAVFIFVGFIAIAMVMAVLQVSSSFKVG